MPQLDDHEGNTALRGVARGLQYAENRNDSQIESEAGIVSHMLYLVRHGIAEVGSASGDADRQLTAAGTRKLHRVVRGLQRLGVVPDLVLSSPLRRAEETAQLLATVLAPKVAVEIYPPLAPGTPMDEILRALRPYRRARQVIMVGHQPGLGQLASHLLTGSATLAMLPFRKGGVAAIQFSALPPRTTGTLQWFVTPKQLRWIAGKGR